jgi:hypothetical protein
MHHWGLLLWDTAATPQSQLVALQLGVGKQHGGEEGWYGRQIRSAV